MLVRDIIQYAPQENGCWVELGTSNHIITQSLDWTKDTIDIQSEYLIKEYVWRYRPRCIYHSKQSFSELIQAKLHHATSWNLVAIKSANGLLPDLHQAITCTNVTLLLIRPFGTYLKKFIQCTTFSFTKKVFWYLICKLSVILSEPKFVELNNYCALNISYPYFHSSYNSLWGFYFIFIGQVQYTN